ncbi:MAG: MlaD family protein, partial [Ignavibacterium sp.]|nr:MlaD family protein [Ignavibacterium sp.]
MFDRKKQLKWASLKVGIVITVTLLIIFFVIVFSGCIQGLFKQRTSLNIYITDVKGLRKGAPVRVAGVDIGAVQEIKLSKEHGTVVKVSIDKDVLNYLKS